MGRLRQRLRIAGALALGLLCLVTPAVHAKQPELRADLEGRPIDAAQASSYYCHDFDFPHIHCFSTPSELEAAVAEPVPPTRQGVDVAAVGPADYVTIYSLPSYAGTFAHLSQNYDVLAAIGWNDTISSYRARNGRTGTFYEHWFAGGAKRNFCCNQNVPSLPSGVDNTFSSVYQT